MEVRFTLHCQIRMRQREIGEPEVIQALSESDSIRPGREDAKIATKILNSKELFVVYLPKSGYKLVLTVYKKKLRR